VTNTIDCFVLHGIKTESEAL